MIVFCIIGFFAVILVAPACILLIDRAESRERRVLHRPRLLELVDRKATLARWGEYRDDRTENSRE